MFKNLLKRLYANRVRKIIQNKVLSLFPLDPHCLGGIWSWSDSVVDIVFPSLLLKHVKTNKTIETALVIHSLRPNQELDSQRLFTYCKENGIPLLLLDYGVDLSEEELKRRIYTVFGGELQIQSE